MSRGSKERRPGARGARAASHQVARCAASDSGVGPPSVGAWMLAPSRRRARARRALMMSRWCSGVLQWRLRVSQAALVDDRALAAEHRRQLRVAYLTRDGQRGDSIVVCLVDGGALVHSASAIAVWPCWLAMNSGVQPSFLQPG